jgi:uncharacterized protein (TIGR00255 family)
MVRSMTGYSSVRAESPEGSVLVSLKSINHRFLDLQVRVPPELEALEPELRRLVREQISRGHVELTVTFDRAGEARLQLDRGLLEAYVEACRQLRRELGFTAEVDPLSLLRVPGIVSASALPTPEELERCWPVLKRATLQALERLNAMRAQEGAALAADLRAHLDRLEQLTASVQAISGQMGSSLRQRLERRLLELGPDLPVDPPRLAQEVALLVSRSDIAEELVRLHSHVRQAAQLLNEETEIGKKLDFLLQEMNREANTILSKTADLPEVGLTLSGYAIEMKAEIEKLREQVQNVE